jgi:hypothetical protein
MVRAKIVLILLFLITLGAGLVAGLLIARWPALAASAEGPTTRPTAARTPLGAELGLTPQQTAQMHLIWEGVRDKVDACYVRAHELQKRRDATLMALLTDPQRAKYGAAQKEYADELARLKADRDAHFQDAVKQTERILDEPQRARYRQILYARLGQDAAGNAPPDWLSPGPATTQPIPAGSTPDRPGP